MKKLKEILSGIETLQINGNEEIAIKDIQIDSRHISAGSVFVALKGTQSDGHIFIEKAVESGAQAIVCEVLPEKKNTRATYVKVSNSHLAVALMACNYYDHPSHAFRLIGVTGTNGKTTVATILYKLFTELGFTCGLVSTVENRIGNNVISATHTTPDAISLNALLSDMRTAKCAYVFMECSSHAIHQHRISGLRFRGGIFTNISHDHLDYHKTFDEYIKVKKAFFDSLPKDAFALSNIDDKRGAVMLQNTKAQKLTYSLQTIADFKGKILENNLSGMLMLVNNKEVLFRLIGAFNAYNILAIYGTAVAEGIDDNEALRVMSMLTSAEGRFDYLISKKKIIGIVDYAHTPDALKNVLNTINLLKRSGEKVITIIGCGGDRDKTKRPLMAREAAAMSDHVVLTSDNPRSENPDQIIRDMEQGLESANRKKTICITDRLQAIKTAVMLARQGDIILLAGKGHEKFQEINGIKNHFDDKEMLQETFELLDK